MHALRAPPRAVESKAARSWPCARDTEAFSGEGQPGGTCMAFPLAFGGPLPASGLCRGLCSDAPPIYASKPTIAGPLPDPARLILMRTDAGAGGFPTD